MLDPPLEVRLVVPPRVLDPLAPEGQTFVRHPWTLHAGNESRDGILVEVKEERQGDAALYIGLSPQGAGGCDIPLKDSRS